MEVKTRAIFEINEAPRGVSAEGCCEEADAGPGNRGDSLTAGRSV